MYDPVLARFVSADSVVPGSASGSLQGIALKPLTVDFHEVGFGATLNGENGQPCWFQLSDTQRQQVGDPWGPQNPQALNRYSYVLNEPMKATDPSGHSVYMNKKEAAAYVAKLRTAIQQLRDIASDANSIGNAATFIAVVLTPLIATGPGGAVPLAAAVFAAGFKLSSSVIGKIADMLSKYADLIDDVINDPTNVNGVIISSECGILYCDITVVSRDTGNGSRMTGPSWLFNPIMGPNFAKGRACTLNGFNPSGGNFLVGDREYCQA